MLVNARSLLLAVVAITLWLGFAACTGTAGRCYRFFQSRTCMRCHWHLIETVSTHHTPPAHVTCKLQCHYRVTRRLDLCSERLQLPSLSSANCDVCWVWVCDGDRRDVPEPMIFNNTVKVQSIRCTVTCDTMDCTARICVNDDSTCTPKEKLY